MSALAITTRHVEAKPPYTWFQWQAGVMELRATQLATYKPHHGGFAGFVAGPREPVFRLMGWGETEDEALAHAKRTERRGAL